MIDDVGSIALYSLLDHVKDSLDFNILFYTTTKVQKEVEIEVKVIRVKGKLS
ncbi:hypothetical protein PTKIN_Ptkin01aG0097500 [Pterospermum kingtungense]